MKSPTARRGVRAWAPGVALVCGLLAASAQADIFSPGELIQGHAHLEGLSNCKACHPQGEELSPKLCLDCHTELATLVRLGKGLHGRMPKAELDACEKCHPDHEGRKAAPTKWGAGGIKGFDHQRSGWSLSGKHAKAECRDCHTPKYIVREEVRSWIKRYPACSGYLGATERCDDCHFDEHRGGTKSTCDKCHDAKDWKPASGFKHWKTKYPLRGKHAKVKCKACHPTVTDTETPADADPKPVASTYLKMAPVPFANCTACHKDDDVHKDKYGQRCEACHDESSWTSVKADGFDRRMHDKHDFKLEGAHAEVECKSCHGPFGGRGKAKYKDLEFERCGDCHPDAHVQQLDPKADCGDCHTTAGYKPSTYDAKAHAKTDFPIDGAHGAVACSACHSDEPALTSRIPSASRRFFTARGRPETFSLTRLTFPKSVERCETCHADVHAGQFEQKACDTCHTNASWSKLSFEHGKDTEFPLKGKHKKANCKSCHLEREMRGAVTAKYTRMDTRCAQCHPDVHLSQFGAAPDCAKCHREEDGFKKSHFEHQPPFTDYLLEGGHVQVKCEGCHPEVEVQRGVKAVRYAPLPKDCAGCHADHHQGDFGGFAP